MGQCKMVVTLLVATSLLFAGCSAERNDFDITRYNLESDVNSTPSSGPFVSERKLSELNESSGLPDFLIYAALNNPGLQAAFDRWKAQLERVPQVKSLPDPRFNYTYFIQEVETRVGPQRQGYGISQLFPWFGKLDLRGDIAMQAANAARQRYEVIKLKLFFEVKDVYYEYYYLARSVVITEENLNLVKHLESVARSRYKVAMGTHPDVIRAQVEAGKLEDRLRTLLDLRGPIVARLNAVLNRPVEAGIPWPRDVVPEDVEVRDEELLAALVATNPELKALDFEITQRRSGIALAQKDYFPDFSLGMSYIETDESTVSSPRDNGKDPLIAIISINLPFWREKYDAGVREALSRHRAARRDKKEMENSLSSQLKMTMYLFRDAERKIDLYRDTLVPKARESLKVTESGFRAGIGTFSDLIDAERILLEFSLAYERALAEHGQELAKLEMLVGQEIPRKGNESRKPNVIDNKTGDSKMEIVQ